MGPNTEDTRTTSEAANAGEAEHPSATRPRTSVGARLAWYALLALVFLVPLTTSNLRLLGIGVASLTFDRFQLPKLYVAQVLSAVGLAGWAWSLLRHGGHIRSNRLLWLAAGLLGVAGASTVLSVEWRTSVFGAYGRAEGLVGICYQLAVMFLAVQLVDSPSRMRTVGRVLVASGTAVAAYGIVQLIGRDPIAWGAFDFGPGRVFSTYGNPDLLADFLVLPLAVSLGLALFDRSSRRVRAAMWAAFAVICACVLVTMVRGAWLAGALAIVIVAAIAIRQRLKPDLVDAGGMAAAVALAAGAGVIALRNAGGNADIVSRARSIVEVGGGSAGQRLDLWRIAMGAIARRPVVGWGPDAFRFAFSSLRTPAFPRAWGWSAVADAAHNHVLQIAATLGVPGALLYFGLIVGVLVATAPLMFGREGSRRRLEASGLWCGLVGLVVALLSGVAVPGITFPLWLTVGTLLAPAARTRVVSVPARLGWLVALLPPLVVGAIAWNTTWVVADYHYRNALVIETRQAAVIDSLERAARLNPLVSAYAGELGAAYGDEARTWPDTSIGKQAAAEDLARAEATLSGAIGRFPSDGELCYILAAVYDTASSVLHENFGAEALRVAERGAALDPANASIIVQVADADMVLGRYSDALAAGRRAVGLDGGYAAGWVVVGRAAESTGDRAQALNAYGTALRLEPGNAAAKDGLARLNGR